MRNKYTILIAVLAACFCSCQKEAPVEPVSGKDVKFKAVSESTKAVLDADWKNFLWESGDSIAIIDGNGIRDYVTSDEGATAIFTSETPIADGTDEAVALYPRSAAQYRDGKMLLSLPSRQNIEAGETYDKNALLSAAWTDEIKNETRLSFKILTSFLKFTVPSGDKVTDLTLQSGENEIIAGTVSVSFDKNGVPSIESEEDNNVIYFHSEDPLDGTYLIPLLPCTLQDGLKVTLRTQDGKTAIHKVVAVDENMVVSAIVFRRAKINYYTLEFSDPQWRNAPEVELLSVSSTTATVRWSGNGFTDPEEDAANSYTARLYSDAACTQLADLQEWTGRQASEYPSALFTDLTPLTDYWVKITDDQTQSSSTAFKFTTEALAGPDVIVGKVFWSDASVSWNYAGEATGYKIYVDGMLKATLEETASSYHITGLECGREYSVQVAAVDEGGREGVSTAQTVTTGTISRLTKNISPTSLSFAIENRAGDNTTNNNPCLYVELLDGENTETANKLFSTYVLDAQIQSPASPFMAALVVGDTKPRPPLNVAFGCLEPGKDYWFRVKSVSRYDGFMSYVTATPVESYVESSNGDSDFSLPLKASTPAAHILQSSEILFQGFDEFMFQADYVNCAVGTVPAFKAAGKKVGNMDYNTIKNWEGAWSFYGLRTVYSSTQIAPHYAWGTQQTSDDDIFKLSAQSSSGTIKGTAPGVGAKVYKFKESAGSLKDWYSSNNTFACQGYIELGAYYNSSDSQAPQVGMIATPAINDISTQTDCTLKFRSLVIQGRSCSLGVWLYSAASKSWTKLTSVALNNSAGSTDVVTQWDAQSDTHRWYDYSLDITIAKGDRIAIDTDKQGAALIDEISITKK